jgi:hypothetical protein
LDDETGGANGTYGGEKKCIQGFDGENMEGKDVLKDPGIIWRRVLDKQDRKM